MSRVAAVLGARRLRRVLVLLGATAIMLPLAVGARAAYVQEGELLVYFDAAMTPTKLPREGLRPVKAGFATSFESLDGSDVPALETMTLRLARGGVIEDRGLARCSKPRLAQRSTTAALSACGDALVGRGGVTIGVRFPDGEPVQARARMLLFNAGRQILMHIYTTDPVESTFVIPLGIERTSGSFGTLLSARFPRFAGGYGSITGFRMTIWRTYRRGGERRGYLLASCPAPKALPGLAFELARVEFGFAGGQRISNASLNTCKAIG
jgi:hypothetical protein